MQKTLKLRPYKPTLLQGLNEDDPDRHTEFCEWYAIRHEADPQFYKTILWSDDATFKLNGTVTVSYTHLFYSQSAIVAKLMYNLVMAKRRE